MSDKNIDQMDKIQNAYAYISGIQKDNTVNLEMLESELIQAKEELKTFTQMSQSMEASQHGGNDLFSPFHRQEDLRERTVIEKEQVKIMQRASECSQEIEHLTNSKKQLENVLECLKAYEQSLRNKEENKNEITSTLEENVNYDSKMHDQEHDSCECIGIKILETQEMERHRIARELHDSTVQNLTSIVHKNELCMKLMDMDLIRARLEMSVMNENIRSIINSMRDIIYDLRPMSILDLGLTATIQKYVKTYMEQNKIQVIFYSDKEKQGILPVVNLTLFRIVQEACNNIAKYADASICKIQLHYTANEIQLEIEDNGCGFDEKEALNVNEPEHSGFGLSIMRERAMLLSGNFGIHTQKGKGTKITVTIPYQN